MKDKLLFGTIGLLVGIVAMQWMMPSTQATTPTQPVGVVVAAAGDAVLCIDGSIWIFFNHDHWEQNAQIPIPVADVQIFSWVSGSEYFLIDKNGDQWQLSGFGWQNNGQPPVGPVATEQSTWGKVKSKFGGK
jgi:hypothetical protein